MNIYYYAVNLFYIIIFIVFFLNVKYYKRLYNKKSSKLNDGTIEIIKCKYNFIGITKNYYKDNYYKITKL